MVVGPLTHDTCLPDQCCAHMSKIEYAHADSETRAQAGPGHWSVGTAVEANLSSGQSLPHDGHQVP